MGADQLSSTVSAPAAAPVIVGATRVARDADPLPFPAVPQYPKALSGTPRRAQTTRRVQTAWRAQTARRASDPRGG
jgi:hypothetical protein